MIDNSFERVRKPPIGEGLNLVRSALFMARAFWCEVALLHDVALKGPISQDEEEAILEVQIGNLLLGSGLELTREEIWTYQKAQELINFSKPMGITLSPHQVRQPEA